ncbi:MAG TPA: DinB family protein [bacterium]|nr:DinB family protein [bacterium]
MNPVRAYDYLMRARDHLFDWVRPLSQEQYTREFPFGLRTLRSTLLDIATGEWVWERRLLAEPIPPFSEWPFSEDRRPTFAALETAWRALAEQTSQTFRSITDWNRVIEFRTTEFGKEVHVFPTAGDIALNLCFHEVHHRAQAMAMLRLLGIPAQNLDYRFLMYPETKS